MGAVSQVGRSVGRLLDGLIWSPCSPLAGGCYWWRPDHLLSELMQVQQNQQLHANGFECDVDHSLHSSSIDTALGKVASHSPLLPNLLSCTRSDWPTDNTKRLSETCWCFSSAQCCTIDKEGEESSGRRNSSGISQKLSLQTLATIWEEDVVISNWAITLHYPLYVNCWWLGTSALHLVPKRTDLLANGDWENLLELGEIQKQAGITWCVIWWVQFVLPCFHGNWRHRCI